MVVARIDGDTDNADRENDEDISGQLRHRARAIEQDGRTLMDVLRTADPSLLYRLADANDEIRRLAQEHRTDMREIRRWFQALQERIAELEQRNREEAAEERGRRLAVEHQPHPPPSGMMSASQLLDLTIKAGSALVGFAAAAWAFVELVVKSG